jgi:nucleoside-diphosphate-sugar epimerase
MQSVLVIGGSGFVGQAAVRAFKRRGCDLAVLNRGKIPLRGVRQLTADRNDPEALRTALGDRRFDLVVDTVCYTPLQATTLVKAIRGKCGTVITVSSGTVYTDRPDKPPAETERAGGAAIWGKYSRDKSLAEETYASAQGYFDQIIAVRPPYLFGPGNNLDREKWFWARQLNDVPVVLPGDGSASAQFIHEDDFGDALHLLATRDSKGFHIFNIADSQVLTFVELVGLLGAVVGRNPEYICLFDTYKDVRVRSWFPFQDYPCLTDPAKLYQLGWRPAKNLKAWFEETYRALLEQGHSFTPVLTEFERRILNERISKHADRSERVAR